MNKILTSNEATSIQSLAEQALRAQALPPYLTRQRESLAGILAVADDVISLAAKSRKIPEGSSGTILQYCAAIDRDNEQNYNRIPEAALTLMDQTVRQIRTLVNGEQHHAGAQSHVVAAVQTATPVAAVSGENGARRVPAHRVVAADVPAPQAHVRPAEERQANLDEELVRFGAEHGIITESPMMEDALDTLRFVARLRGHVLIRGETGTGKELFSKAVHKASNRSDQPFVTVDGAAIDSHLIKDELFGHDKGAFTNADKARKGKLEMAGTGTIFLDEIGRWNLDAQGILLGVLEGRDINRLGSSGEKPIPMNARIVAATNADLEDLVNRGLFMEDLYYRLQQLRLELPTLHERGKHDVGVLAKHFFQQAQAEFGIMGKWQLDEQTLAALQEYPWPGNVRQIKHVIQQSFLNACRQQARGMRLSKKNNRSLANENVVMPYHVEDALATYRRLDSRQKTPVIDGHGQD